MTSSGGSTPDAAAMLERMTAFAFPGGRIEARGVLLRQRGQMWRERGGAAMPFEATQYLDATRPQFRWSARFHLAKVVPLSVIDAYEGGRGRLDVRVAGLRVARAEGPETDEGELLRYLSELPWCPFAMSHPAIEWASVEGEPGRLRATLRDGRIGASVVFTVGGDGAVSRVEAAMRPRQVGKRFEPTPWWGEFGGYSDLGGMRVPTRASVFWGLAGGPFEYFRCEVTSAEAAGGEGR
ncbi:MAG: DUF6544 family protein [Dehalococcoidia bacterium]